MKLKNNCLSVECQDVAQLIMERTTVLNHVLPQDGRPGTDLQNSALMALVNLYANYLRKAKEYDTEAYSWVSSSIVKYSLSSEYFMNLVSIRVSMVLLRHFCLGSASILYHCAFNQLVFLFYVMFCLLQSNTQDKIILQWKSGESATMRIVVVHAMVILLTYGAPQGNIVCYNVSLPVTSVNMYHMPVNG